MYKIEYEEELILNKDLNQYFTHESIIKFMSKAIIDITNKEFNDLKFNILDPAAGTGRFMLGITQECNKNKLDYHITNIEIDENLIPILNKHSKLYNINSTNILGNTLELNNLKDFSIIIGNPPYKGESFNKGKWIEHLLDDYKQEPTGGKLKEKNSKWINDDYVKFMKYAQNLIEKNNEGILAFINPHGFLDNPTFRGMRYNLLQTYDKIYILDLHGNSNKIEICPDGSPDENVFPIKQGVSINIFIKKKKNKNKLAQVFHCDLYGKRKVKYDYLLENSLSSVKFQKLETQVPHYFFVKKDYKAQAEYDRFFSISKLFPISVMGFQTHRDSFAISENKQNLKNRIIELFDNQNTSNDLQQKYSLKNTSSWNFEEKRTTLICSNPESNIARCAYRIFDDRYVITHQNINDRPRLELQNHVVNKNNLSLLISKQQSILGFQHVFITNLTANDCVLSSRSKEGNQVFMLYRYPSKDELIIDGQAERTPNLDEEIVAQFAEKLKITFTNEKEEDDKTFAPIDILDYIYGILHSPNYRDKFKEFLKIDFPRVSYPEDMDFFFNFVKQGSKLRKLHLMEDTKIITDFSITGNNKIEKIKFDKETGKIWINKTQYFSKVPKITFDFYIGGYQPAQKWLKDRKGRELSNNDIMHYQKIIYILTQTDNIMKQINELYSF